MVLSGVQNLSEIIDQPGAEDSGNAQRDWLMVTDADDARAWMRSITSFLNGRMRDVAGSRFEYSDCWPWHPRAVVALLALEAHYDWAYAEGPDKVSDFLDRFLDRGVSRFTRATSGCSTGMHREHPDADAVYRVDLARRDDYVSWWATSRDGEAPGLTLI